MIQPFFTYLGGKHRLAGRLGPPQRDHTIEPFAGSAGFSTFWEPAKVTLVERDPVIFGVWNYLQRATPEEILALPSAIDSVEQLPASVCQEARWLIGFWLNHGLARPGRSRSKWARRPAYRRFFWSETIKHRLAFQVSRISHWRIIEGDYRDAPDIEGHWHIDPPYESPNKTYRFQEIDYVELADWCRARKGFTHVCANADATWLPFETYAVVSNRFRNGTNGEAVFEMGDDE